MGNGYTVARVNPAFFVGDEVKYKGKRYIVDDPEDEKGRVRIYPESGGSGGKRDKLVPPQQLTLVKADPHAPPAGARKHTRTVLAFDGHGRPKQLGRADTSPAAAALLGARYEFYGTPSPQQMADGALVYVSPVGHTRGEYDAAVASLRKYGVTYRENPTMKKTAPKKTAAKKAPAKKAAAKKTPTKKKGGSIQAGGFISDVNGQIFRVTKVHDDGTPDARFSVRDFDSVEHNYWANTVKKAATPYMPGERIRRNGEDYTVISQEFVGIVNARNARTGVRTQLGLKGAPARENPIRTLEGRVLTAPGTRKSASKLMLMRKSELENGQPLTSRIKLSSGKWLTYQSAQWVLSHGRAGSSGGPRKKGSAAPRAKKSGGGTTVVQDAFDWINEGFGGSD